MKQVERVLAAQLYVNGGPVPMVEGRQRGQEISIVWRDREGKRWEGAVSDLQRTDPREGEIGVVQIHFTVPFPRRVYLA